MFVAGQRHDRSRVQPSWQQGGLYPAAGARIDAGTRWLEPSLTLQQQRRRARAAPERRYPARRGVPGTVNGKGWRCLSTVPRAYPVGRATRKTGRTCHKTHIRIHFDNYLHLAFLLRAVPSARRPLGYLATMARPGLEQAASLRGPSAPAPCLALLLALSALPGPGGESPSR